MIEDRRDTADLVTEMQAEQRRGNTLRIIIVLMVGVVAIVWAVITGSHCVEEKEKRWAPHANPPEGEP